MWLLRDTENMGRESVPALTAWTSPSSPCIKVGEEGVQLIWAEEGVSAELALHSASCRKQGTCSDGETETWDGKALGYLESVGAPRCSYKALPPAYPTPL